MTPESENQSVKPELSTSQLLFTGVFLAVLGWLLATSLSMFIGKAIAGDERAIGFLNGTDIQSQAELNLFRLLRGFQNFLLWGLPGFAWWMLVRRTGHRPLTRLSFPRLIVFMVAGSLLICVCLPLMQNLVLPSSWFYGETTAWVNAEEAVRANAIMTMVGNDGATGFMMNLLVLCFIPAVAEELFFRGAMQRVTLQLVQPWLAVLLTAAIFSAVHMQFLGFFSRFALGMLMGWFVLRSGTLWVSIAAHFCFNAMNLVLARLAVNGTLPEAVLQPDFRFHWAWAAASAGAALLGVWVFGRLRRE